MFGGNDDSPPPPPPSAPLQQVTTEPTPAPKNIAGPGSETAKVAGAMDANIAKPATVDDENKNKSLLGQ